jgi:hypothetical protein
LSTSVVHSRSAEGHSCAIKIGLSFTVWEIVQASHVHGATHFLDFRLVSPPRAQIIRVRLPQKSSLKFILLSLPKFVIVAFGGDAEGRGGHSASTFAVNKF